MEVVRSDPVVVAVVVVDGRDAVVVIGVGVDNFFRLRLLFFRWFIHICKWIFASKYIVVDDC